MAKWLALSGFIAAAFASGPAYALYGDLQFGSISPNFYDPATKSFPGYIGSISPSCGNYNGPDVAIGAGVEFCYGDRDASYTADFTSDSLTITQSIGRSGAGNAIETFTSAIPYAFSDVTLVSSTFPGLTFNATGTTLTIKITPGPIGPVNDFSATFAGVNAVPEPASWAMFIGGFGLIGGAMRRRRTSISFA